jgi:diaminopimelate decarboxylase
LDEFEGIRQVMSNSINFLEQNSIFLEYIDGVLHFDDMNIKELLKRIKTPAFILSERVLLHQYAILLNAFSSLETGSFAIAFSVKSNPFPEVAKTFANKNAYFEVTSINEIKHALDQGCLPSRIIFTNIVKSVDAIEYAVHNNIGLLAIDSWSDMKRIENISRLVKKKISVLIRVNPGIEIDQTVFACSGKTSKIGIAAPKNLKEESSLKKTLQYCINSHWLDFQGIHVHIGSQIVDITQYERGMKVIGKIIEQLILEGIEIKILDIGGGFPVDYDDNPVPKINEFVESISRAFNPHLKKFKLIIESGRYLTAPAGLLALHISVIKGEKNETPIVCVDGSFFNTIPDVIVANWLFPIKKVIKEEKTQMISYRIVGSSNDTLDYYKGGKSTNGQVFLPKLREGEYIVFLQAGAYSISFNSSYCMEERPYVYFINKSIKNP